MPTLWPHLETEVAHLDAWIAAQLTGTPHQAADVSGAPWSADSPFVDLGQAFGLDALDLHLLLLALAPEADAQYQAAFAFANGDGMSTWPTAAIAHRLLAASDCRPSLGDIVRKLSRDGATAQQRLIRLIPTGRTDHLVTAAYGLTPAVSHFLLRSEVLCESLGEVARRSSDAGATVDWNDLPAATCGALQRIPTLLRQRPVLARPVILVVANQRALPQRIAGAIASQVGFELLTVDTASSRREIADELALQIRLKPEAVFLDALAGTIDAADLLRLIHAARLPTGVPVIVGCPPGALSREVASRVRSVVIDLVASEFEDRQHAWDRALAREQLYIGPRERAALADRFPINAPQIDAVVHAAVDRMALDAGESTDVYTAVVNAVRGSAGATLVPYATKIQPRMTWDDLVLPPLTLERLHALTDAIRHRHIVYRTWHFSRRTAAGTGVKALFAGPSGTGKTITAGIMAAELGFDLYRIDLSTLVSKYIGETEKHLDAIFAGAEAGNAILFFDEADALFGKRSGVKDAHDRYANLEVAYLLQKLEEHDGVVVLATNLKRNIDEAFARRMHYVIEFAVPDAPARERLWRGMFSPQAPVGEDVDWPFLARQFTIAGGDIRNVVLDAAFLAARNGGAIGMHEIMNALGRQTLKQGKLPSRSDFQQYHHLVAPD